MTTTSPASGSSDDHSQSFGRLHPAVQRWVYDQGWGTLHDVQERAIPIVLGGDTDLVIAAATAAGKTEAAFLPICSVLASLGERVGQGPNVLYVSPLKALINDQFDRLELMAERCDVPVHRWHGDVGASEKQRASLTAGGILLITPESLEAFLDRRGTEVAGFFGQVRFVVIDELHSFLGNPRGAQLQSLLNRVERASRRRPPRIGLSATLGDMGVAVRFLRPETPDTAVVVESLVEQEIQLQVRGYRVPKPPTPGTSQDEEAPPADIAAIADHLFCVLRGSDNLVFANSRANVEIYADRLAELSADRRCPNEFWPHHGNLAKSVREEVERQLKDRSRPATAICTSTLELGIDIGTVTSVAQIGPPPSVAALRQRLGRSGRRDDPSILRIYVSEQELDSRTALVDLLRCDLVQTIAMVELLLDRWLEKPSADDLNLSTLIQQTLGLIAQRGGVRPTDAHRVLCGPGPFSDVGGTMYADLLRDLAREDLIVQASDGTLLLGPVGERYVNHYSFYAAFATAEEWRLVAGGQTLGTMPIDRPLEAGGLLLFAGRRWRIVDVDGTAKVIELVRATAGVPPRFGGGAQPVTQEVRDKMLHIYEGRAVPRYLDATARELLAEARSAWRRFELSGSAAIGWDGDSFLLPWVGDDVLSTMMLALRRAGIDAESEGPFLRLVSTPPDDAQAALSAISISPRPPAAELAHVVENREKEKWDWALGTELSVTSYARSCLDVDAAWAAFDDLASKRSHEARGGVSSASESAPQRSIKARRPAPAGPIEFCVLDVETTGFSHRLGDRVIEVATVRLLADGTILDEWSTLIDPQRTVTGTEIHGIAANDVSGAPVFSEIAGDLTERLDGAVVAGHNLRFDWGFLVSEFEHAGHRLASQPSICTIALGAQALPNLTDRRLVGHCDALDIPLPDAHAAAVDARATAQILVACIERTWRGGTPSLEALGCDPLTWPASMPDVPPTGRVRRRQSHEAPDLRQADSDVLIGLAGQGERDPDLSAYLQVLDRALADRRLTDAEAVELQCTAEDLNIDSATLQEAHRRYLETLVAAARTHEQGADSIPDIERVERLLGLDVLDVMLGTDREIRTRNAAS